MFLAHYVFIRVIDLTIRQIQVIYIVVLNLQAAAIGNGQLIVLKAGKFDEAVTPSSF